MDRQQKIALVTGANKGIGFEVARQLMREGFRVFLGARDEKAGKAAADKLNQEAEASGSNHVTCHPSLSLESTSPIQTALLPQRKSLETRAIISTCWSTMLALRSTMTKTCCRSRPKFSKRPYARTPSARYWSHKRSFH